MGKNGLKSEKKEWKTGEKENFQYAKFSFSLLSIIANFLIHDKHFDQ